MLLVFSLVFSLTLVSSQTVSRDEYTADGWFYRTNSNLGEVPSDIPRGAVGIYLNNNNIETIRPTDFSDMTALTFLGLQQNVISEIQDQSFKDLARVTELWLHNNNLRDLKNDVFKGLTSLEELLLSNNPITTTERYAFAGLTNLKKLFFYECEFREMKSNMFSGLSSLEELTLTKNKIYRIESGAFSGLGNLKKLWLDWNALTDVSYDMFLGLNSLERLALHHNNLTSIKGGIFTGLFNLKILDMDDNQIATLRSDAFRGMESLSEVWLYNNRLTTVDASVFSGLPRSLQLTLGSNPLQCDSNLCWLKQGYVTWLQFEQRPQEPSCANGMSWSSLSCPVQVDQCPDPGQVERAKRTGTGPFKVGSKVTYTCDFCYMGSKTITCQSNGQWSDKPVCRDVRCPDLGDIPNGKRSTNGPFTCSALVGYECDDDYVLTGSGMLVCRGDATWSAPKPQCLRKPSSKSLPDCKDDFNETRWLVVAIAAGVAGLFVAVICTASCMECCNRRRKVKKMKG